MKRHAVDYLLIAVLVVMAVASVWILESNVNDSMSKIKAMDARLTRLEKLELIHHGSP